MRVLMGLGAYRRQGGTGQTENGNDEKFFLMEKSLCFCGKADEKGVGGRWYM